MGLLAVLFLAIWLSPVVLAGGITLVSLFIPRIRRWINQMLFGEPVRSPLVSDWGQGSQNEAAASTGVA